MSAALEIGTLYPGSVELKFSEGGGSYEGWTHKPNAFDGVGVKHEVYNASDKRMKYITFVYIAYNSVGDVVSCKVSGKVEARGRLTGPVEPYEKTEVRWEALWYNPTIDKVELKEVIIQYMDDTEETIKGEDIVNINNHESVYYQKCGKQEQADAKKERLKFCYLSFMVFWCLSETKVDKTAKFHANQGLLLFILEVVGVLIGGIPKVGNLLSFILIVFAIVFSIKGRVDIGKNKQSRIPLIGRINILK